MYIYIIISCIYIYRYAIYIYVYVWLYIYIINIIYSILNPFFSTSTFTLFDWLGTINPQARHQRQRRHGRPRSCHRSIGRPGFTPLESHHQRLFPGIGSIFSPPSKAKTLFAGKISGKYKKPSGVIYFMRNHRKKGNQETPLTSGNPCRHGNLMKICNKIYPKFVINNSPRIICQVREFEMLLWKSFNVRSLKKFPYIVIHLAEMIAGQKFSGTTTLPETNIAPENRQGPKRKYILQPSIFRGKPLVSGSVLTTMILKKKV